MNLLHRWITLGVVLGGFALHPCAVQAQDWSDAGSIYGQGVHAYFSGQSSQAESYLSRALAIESGDPRLYYFRALSLMRLGRMDEARGDMMVGANLEARYPNRFAVGRALERVQGSNRLVLEQYRRQGRADAVSNREQLRRERYPQTFDQDSQVLRRQIVIPVDHLMQPGGPRPLTAEELASQPPIFRPRGREMYKPAGATRPAPSVAGDDPFRDDPQGAADAAPTVGGAQSPATEIAPTSNDTGDEADASPFEAESAPESYAEDPEDDPFGSL